MARSKYLFVASMDVAGDREDLFNEVYNIEHCPLLGKVPGVRSVSRFETTSFSMAIGGEIHTIVPDGEPKYHAIYEIDDPEVLESVQWSDSVDSGRWPGQVRPYTSNRRHSLLRLTYPPF
jgi:hypothetical protein